MFPKANLSLLFIDNDEDLNFLHKVMFELNGCQVEVARSFAEAATTLNKYTPDVIVADLFLEDVTGLDLAWRLRSTPSSKNVSIVALTSCYRPGIAQEARNAGFDAYLLKPTWYQQLVEVIKPMAGSHR